MPFTINDVGAQIYDWMTRTLFSIGDASFSAAGLLKLALLMAVVLVVRPRGLLGRDTGS